MSYYTDRTDYFKSAHRCVRCGKKDESTESGNQRCYACIEKGKITQKKWNADHREQLTKAQRERRAFLKAHGICVVCAKEKALEGHSLCKSCRDKSRARYLKRVYKNG